MKGASLPHSPCLPSSLPLSARAASFSAIHRPFKISVSPVSRHFYSCRQGFQDIKLRSTYTTALSKCPNQTGNGYNPDLSNQGETLISRSLKRTALVEKP
ncbi:hypothetical protein GKIL_4236 [Gloeobacter kilaueensis JS1]|uniref:Uncharacterized protein n=1 Tax=Gloeobacter kilaueensis (strain ATCC BAA-2537 / CCAP 1431/1 / ULC 316 / JS1) TaxID=1183438 RepID=U5QNB7_GLOK1|nr:hypothetical protein GKIL_4236 [Gloeobacter kilaueensis JS1]